MKNRLFIHICLLILPVLYARPTRVCAQKIEFQYGPDKSLSGSIKIDADYLSDGNVGTLFMVGQPLSVNMRGATKGKIRFLFSSKNLDINKKYTFAVRTSCYPSGTLEIRPSNQKEIELRTRETKSERLDFDIVKNGSGELVVGYDITKEGEDLVRCSHEFVVPYRITGIPELDREACQRALSAFNTNKTVGIPQLEAVMKTYPNPPCKDEIEDILEQYAVYKKAQSLENTNCLEAKKICSAYLSKYKIGGKFTTEIILINNCKPKAAPPANRQTGAAVPVSDEDRDWRLIQNSKNPDEISAFISKYPGGKYTEQAGAVLSRLSPIEVQEQRISDTRREFILRNTTRPRIKNMSLTNGLVISAESLESANQFSVNLERPGEYAVRIIDALGKDTTIRISSAFDGSMSALPDGSGYFIKISGGRKPYVVTLEDLSTGKQSTFRGSINTDTLIMTLAELKKRDLEGQFSVKVKSNGSPTLLELGSVSCSAPKVDPINTILWLLGILVGVLILYLIVIVMRNQNRNRKKKTNTIYDQVNY